MQVQTHMFLRWSDAVFSWFENNHNTINLKRCVLSLIPRTGNLGGVKYLHIILGPPWVRLLLFLWKQKEQGHQSHITKPYQELPLQVCNVSTMVLRERLGIQLWLGIEFISDWECSSDCELFMMNSIMTQA